ncbi:ArsR/SmtB family transcription factor [Actinospica robiniae]|uniref:ArsR/SmtB family transcription factor n=1 Tax=Actinospica robiniae TaxID=304901 RepID=UPI001FE1857B|nr:metalloregulator ArsR/SmtB family transcription factor [Actinospica robiniae]
MRPDGARAAVRGRREVAGRLVQSALGPGASSAALADRLLRGRRGMLCDLTGPFDVSQPTISHHLKVLREAGLIDSERRGTWVYYWVLPGALARLGSLLAVDDAADAGAR